jgi:hypothetical protein
MLPVTTTFETESAARFWANRDCSVGISTAHVPMRQLSVVLEGGVVVVGVAEQLWRRRLLFASVILNESVPEAVLWKVEVTRNVCSFEPVRHCEVEVMAKV